MYRRSSCGTVFFRRAVVSGPLEGEYSTSSAEYQAFRTALQKMTRALVLLTKRMNDNPIPMTTRNMRRLYRELKPDVTHDDWEALCQTFVHTNGNVNTSRLLIAQRGLGLTEDCVVTVRYGGKLIVRDRWNPSPEWFEFVVPGPRATLSTVVNEREQVKFMFAIDVYVPLVNNMHEFARWLARDTSLVCRKYKRKNWKALPRWWVKGGEHE